MTAGALAAHARGLVASGDHAAALPVAARALQILKELGSIEEFEPLVRLAWIEVLVAASRPAEAAVAIAEAQRSIRERAAAITDDAWRQSFLECVPENVATLRLAAPRQ